MIFFRKKKEAKPAPAEAPKPKKPPILMASEERILTAEGWRRYMEKTAQKPRGKAQ